MPRRGRPEKIDKTVVTEILMKYKKDIVKEDLKIVSKSDPIWFTIAMELNNIMTPNALYTFITCNKFGIRNKLSDCPHALTSCEDINNNSNSIREGENEENVNEEEDERQNNTKSTMFDSTLNESNISLNKINDVTTFIITMPKDDYTSMVIYKKYRRREKNRPISIREYAILQPGVWQHIFSEKIWESTKISCGFNFKRHKLTQKAESGYAHGACKCGSVIKCVIDNTDDFITKIKCTYIEGQGRCGKRYLRNPVREGIVEKFQGITATKYRAEIAEKLMEENDIVEPPHLYSANVLRVAKHEHMQKNYIDKDPIKALYLMQLGSLQNIIHNIGLNPFFVHYWSNYQLHVFRTYVSNEISCIYIDATGSIIRKIKKPDKTKSKHIFLYNCVANSKKSGLFPVCQMLSEVHNTNAIHYWLMEWIRSGASRPREVVCDANRALLTAAVRSFTGYLTIEEYSDACKSDNLPSCYIRIDVAHFIKTYVNFLKNSRPRVKIFYLSLLGKLIMSCNINTSEEILQAIFIIALSETEGMTINDEMTICETYKLKIKALLTSSTENIFTDDNFEQSNNIDIAEDSNCNKWSQWGQDIYDKVQEEVVNNEGNRENAHYMPALADRLMKDIKLIPMWSCIGLHETQDKTISVKILSWS